MSELLQTECFHIDNNPDFAAALAALGFSVIPTKNADMSAPTISRVVVGFRSSRHSRDGNFTAHDLLAGLRDNSLTPTHPLLSALMGIRARRYLTEWMKGDAPRPHVCIPHGNQIACTRAPSGRTQSADISPHLQGEFDPSPLLMDPDHAAAAIVAGHGVRGIKGGQIEITQRNAFHPSLKASTLAAAGVAIATSPLSVATTVLPGAPAGEHPFLYALMGIQCAKVLTKAAREMPPIWRFTAKHGPREALIYEPLLDQPGPTRDHLHRHLK